MVEKEAFFAELRARRPDVFKRRSGGVDEFDAPPVVDSTRVVWRGLLEQELREKHDAETSKILREELLRSYQQDGYTRDEPKKLLQAVEEGDEQARREIIEAKVRRYEETQQYSYAADELQAIGEWKRSGDLWLKAGENAPSGTEFAFAAQSFVRGGEVFRKSHSRVADLLKVKIAGLPSLLSGVYFDHVSALGSLLEKAGRHEEALEAYLEGSHYGDSEYDKHRIAAIYWERQGEWKKAVEAQEKFVKSVGTPGQDDFLKLAELKARVGDWKGHARARWQAGDFLHAARVAFELDGRKDYFERAAKAYLRQPFNTTRDFFSSVWHLAKNATRSGSEEQGVAKALSLLHAAYGLLAPPQSIEKLSPEEHWQRATELSKQFGGLKAKTSGSKLASLFSQGLHAQALLHAASSHKSGELVFGEELKRFFKGLPRPRRPKGELPPELAEAYSAAAEHQQWLYGGDPQEMAGRCFEECGFYKQAAGAYKKAELHADFQRAKALEKQAKPPAKPRKKK